ncbi:MAG: tetratricopeptide repeat protein [Thermoanaerobaculia bacterium]|nr:tetratricopeptide repeat protein [Thermoanaerobaculia bacterium]
MRRTDRPTRRRADGALCTAAVALLLCVAGNGCSLFRPAPADDPTAIDEPDSEIEGSEDGARVEGAFPDPSLEENLEAEALLALGDSRLAEGDLSGAAATYLELVDLYPRTDEAAQALFQLAALQLNPSSPIYDSGKAVATLERLELEHPGSPWAPAATLLLELTRQNADLEQTLRALRTQLDELKQLDLAPDPSDG